MTKLTDEQRVFAEENHGLILSFLGRKHLNYDEWYDILALKYLYAVSTYQSDKAAFSTYVFYVMEQGVQAEYLARSRQNRALNFNLTSLNDLVGDESKSTKEIIDTISDNSSLQDDSDFKISFHSFLDRLPEMKRKIFILRTKGYRLEEISKILSLSVSKERIRQIIKECIDEFNWLCNSYCKPVENAIIINPKKQPSKMTKDEILDFISRKSISVNQIEKHLGLSSGLLHHRLKNLNAQWEAEILEVIQDIESERIEKINADIECIVQNVNTNQLSKRERDFIEMYRLGFTFNEISDKYNITRNRVKQIFNVLKGAQAISA